MLIMEAMQWYSLRAKGFNRPASVLRKKILLGAKRMKK